MIYAVSEKFFAPQGEGLYTGTPMAFIRLAGCSVGKGICTACDTDFDGMYAHLGGGKFTPEELKAWSLGYEHVCITGGEPLDRDLRPLIETLTDGPTMCHVETSGTKWPDWLDSRAPGRPGVPNRDPGCLPRTRAGEHMIRFDNEFGSMWREMPLWVTCSPKPGYNDQFVEGVADEIKVIAGGLGAGPGWPDLDMANFWSAELGRLVYWQPRNGVLLIDRAALDEAIGVVGKNPALRLSCQLHKFLKTR